MLFFLLVMNHKGLMGDLNPLVLCESMSWYYILISTNLRLFHICSIVVAASDNMDQFWEESNYGELVTIIAPVSVSAIILSWCCHNIFYPN